MKAGRIKRNVILLILGVACLFISSVAQASDYLGHFCWQSSSGDVYQFAVTHMGNDHYLLNGKSVSLSGFVTPLHGNAEIGEVDGILNIFATVTGGLTKTVGTGTLQLNWALNLVNFHGTGAGTLIVTDFQNQSTRTLIQETLTNFVCP